MGPAVISVAQTKPYPQRFSYTLTSVCQCLLHTIYIDVGSILCHQANPSGDVWTSFFISQVLSEKAQPLSISAFSHSCSLVVINSGLKTDDRLTDKLIINGIYGSSSREKLLLCGTQSHNGCQGRRLATAGRKEKHSCLLPIVYFYPLLCCTIMTGKKLYDRVKHWQKTKDPDRRF